MYIKAEHIFVAIAHNRRYNRMEGKEGMKGSQPWMVRSTLFRRVLFYNVAAVEMNRESRARARVCVRATHTVVHVWPPLRPWPWFGCCTTLLNVLSRTRVLRLNANVGPRIFMVRASRSGFKGIRPTCTPTPCISGPFLRSDEWESRPWDGREGDFRTCLELADNISGRLLLSPFYVTM